MTSFLFDGEGFEFSHLQRMAQLNGQRLSLKKQQELLEAQKQLLDEAKKQAAHAEELKKRSLDKVSEPCGPACPHCGGDLPSDAKTMLYRKCRHCTGDLFWFSGIVYGDRETFEATKQRAAYMAAQAQANADKAKANAELKSLRDLLSRLDQRDIPGKAVSAVSMPVVITGAEWDTFGGESICVKADLLNDTYNIIKSLRIVFLSDSRCPASAVWRGSISPQGKARVTFDIDSETMGSGGSLWVAIASSAEGQEWEQSLKEAYRQPRGVIELAVADRPRGTGREAGAKLPPTQAAKVSTGTIAAGNSTNHGLKQSAPGVSSIQLGICLYACAILVAADGKATAAELEIVGKGLDCCGLAPSVLQEKFVDACRRVRKDGIERWVSVTEKSLREAPQSRGKGMSPKALIAVLESLVDCEVDDSGRKKLWYERLRKCL